VEALCISTTRLRTAAVGPSNPVFFFQIFIHGTTETSSVFTPRGQSLRYGAHHTNSGADFNGTPGCTIRLLNTHKTSSDVLKGGIMRVRFFRSPFAVSGKSNLFVGTNFSIFIIETEKKRQIKLYSYNYYYF